MSMIEWSGTPITPSALEAILRRHKMLPAWAGQPQIQASAAITTYGCIYDSDQPKATCLAILLFRFGQDQMVGVLDFIPTVKNPKDRITRANLAKSAEFLRATWFDELGLRRVECRIPLRRTRWISGLKAIGFRCETKPSGMRAAIDYGVGPEPVGLFSLIPGDMPPPIDFHESSNDTVGELEEADLGTRELEPGEEGRQEP